ncbi:diguanylate cyclase domain-containing protein [Dapis sp. BLCC M126]|uniref:diguanylate cyclase domain-containing protein n=1 Tax=Dapis sp. BLCC M126 TaxID=3400189 RepID=UPI003CF664FD
MVLLPGYLVLDQIHESMNSEVYRAIREEDAQRVILKVLKADYPTLSQLTRYKQEYELTRHLNLEGVIKAYSLEQYQIIILEDFGGESLNIIQKSYQFDLADFLDIAIKVTTILAQIHAENIIHKDINPANIIYNPKTKQLKIIDFGISTRLTRENPILKNPNILEGTLAYISPEQTGRMNRGIDYRTDLYSLGVTFFQLLTDDLPFNTQDSVELVHCHIAQPVKFPIIKNREIPEVLQAIVLKLMAKNAEDRYQNTWGLKYDLEKCREQLNVTGKITEFDLGERDVSHHFLIPEKLYGREAEVQTLLNAFENVASGTTEMILVAGFSGIGKTAIVNEVHKPIVKQRGYFIKGKYDQLNRNIPFSAFTQAFRELMGQLLSESDAELVKWKSKILEVVGENGQVIIDVIPELERIIGKQPPVAELSGSAAQNRFNLLFSKFVEVFTKQEHPLVIFLDDLQWADSASLNLLKLLMNDGKVEYLLVLGAYRDNEVFPAHPLMLILDEIQKQAVEMKTLTLAPLDEVNITCLVADTLMCSVEIATPLAQLVYQKTKGNPFFITQFLQGLYEDGWIIFDAKVGYWQCNLTQVRQLALTDDVVEFMVERLQKLPETTRDVMKLSACIGNRFDLATLAIVQGKTPGEVATDLWQGLREGFIIPESEVYKFFMGEQNQEREIKDVSVGYHFLHDRVQQAAYALIPNNEKARFHYDIGQLILQKASPEAREERIFELVSQLNHGTSLITNQTERDELAKFNLIACRKAKNATAYQAGREYVKIGLSLLGKNAWSRQYKMTLEFYELGTELAALCGDFEVMEKLIEIVIANTSSLPEQINVYRIQIQSYNTRNLATEAITIAKQFLRQLGVSFPETPTQNDIQQAVSEISLLVNDTEIENLVELPIMEDREKIAIVEITNSIMPATYLSGSPLFPLLVALSVKLSIQYGHTRSSPFAYSCYGIVACSVLQDIDVAVKFGQLALQVVSKLDLKGVKPLVIHIVMFFLLHYKSHIKETVSPLQEGYGIGLEVGNLEFAGYNAHGFCLQSFLCSQPLAALEQSAHTYFDGLVQLNQLVAANWCRSCWQTTLNLLGIGKYPTLLSGDSEQEVEFISKMVSGNDSLGLSFFYLYKMILCYLFEEIESIEKDIEKIKEYVLASPGLVTQPVFYFYDSLMALGRMSERKKEVSEVMERVADNQRQLKQQWAESAPMNYQHKVDLVEAEKCRVLGKKGEAIELYDKAILGAKENKYLQEEALANELAAKFYLSCAKEKVASIYMQEAYYCYTTWGAKAKTNQLEEQYPQLLTLIFQSDKCHPHPSHTRIQTSSRSQVTTTSSDLDLASVIKASQAISEEIELEVLLSKMTRIVAENAGANKCVLILYNSGSWEIVSQWVDGNYSLCSISMDHHTKILPDSVINTVKRTQQTLLINNIEQDTIFARDSYLIENQPKSLCCTPILNQAKLIGLLYLENSLTVEAFTDKRLEILNLLSSQAAISIQNAKFYAQVRENESKLRQFLDAMPVAVGIVDASGHPYYTNHIARELLGNVTSSEVSEVYQIYQPGTEEKYPEANLPIVRALHGETVRDDNIEIHQGDRRIAIEACGTPVYDKQGKIKYAITTFQDITERKQAEKILSDYNQTLQQQVAQRTAELEKANQELLRIANVDGLTQIPNRRSFDESLAVEWRRHLREQQFLSLIMIDIDYFKRYNDHYGHQGGDDCLIRVAQAISQVPQRPTDLVARYGGEEFAVILPNTNIEGGFTIAESIRLAIASLSIPHAQSEVSQFVSLSLGVASVIPTIEGTTEDLIALADEALYKAKRQGRDRVVFSRN